MKNGIVTIAGAGPGDVDLLTLRCRDAIEEADIIVYAGSLVNPEVLRFARNDCQLYDSAGMDLEDITKVLTGASRAGRKVLRLHTGDPSIYGATAEQMRRLRDADVAYEVIPGVTALFAAAASVKCELTVPGQSQSVIMTRRAGRTPVPEGEELVSLASHGATMALYLSVADIDGVVRDLKQGGYNEATPAAVVYRATWSDEQIVRGRLADIADKVKKSGIGRQAIVLVGDSIEGKGDDSYLYHAGFSHGYRSAEERDGANSDNDSGSVSPDSGAGLMAASKAGFNDSAAVYAVTDAGCELARKLADELDADVFVPERWAESAPEERLTTFAAGEFGQTVIENWNKYAGHVFVMAAGIVVRKIASLLTDKTKDPAVVVCDEAGRHAISLLSGHIGGANRLAEDVAKIIGGSPVVTTATDVRGVTAFDDLAARYGWDIVNPEMLKPFNTMLLQKRPVAVCCPEKVVQETYGDREGIIQVDDVNAIPPHVEGLAVLDKKIDSDERGIPVLHLRRRTFVIGIGCRRGVSATEIEDAIQKACQDAGVEVKAIEKIASIDIKRDEQGLRSAGRKLGLDIVFFPAEQLQEVPVPTPSEHVLTTTGSPSVAEAAALLAGGGKLLLRKKIESRVTIAIADKA